MKIIILDGPPSELLQIPQLNELLRGRTAAARGPVNGSETPDDQEPEVDFPPAAAPIDDTLVSADLIRRALLRKGISDNQVAALRVLCETPDWVSKADLASRARIPETALPGVFGGISLRFTSTRGWPRRNRYHGRPYLLYMDMEKRDGEIFYRARDVLRQGVEQAHIFNGGN